MRPETHRGHHGANGVANTFDAEAAMGGIYTYVNSVYRLSVPDAARVLGAASPGGAEGPDAALPRRVGDLEGAVAQTLGSLGIHWAVYVMTAEGHRAEGRVQDDDVVYVIAATMRCEGLCGIGAEDLLEESQEIRDAKEKLGIQGQLDLAVELH